MGRIHRVSDDLPKKRGVRDKLLIEIHVFTTDLPLLAEDRGHVGVAAPGTVAGGIDLPRRNTYVDGATVGPGVGVR